MGVQTESLEDWLQAYVEEKGGPPRNAMQVCAFARNRGTSLKYREVCDALACSRSAQVAENGEESHCRLRSESAGAGLRSAATAKEARFRCDSPARELHPAKLRFSWMLQLDGDMKVELLYSRRTGKKQVLIDGKAMFKTFQQCFEWSWQHPEQEVRIFLNSDHDHHELFCEGSCAPKAERPSRISEASCDGRLEDVTSRRDLPINIPITPRSDRFTCLGVSESSATSSTAKPTDEWRHERNAEMTQEVPRDIKQLCSSPESSSRESELTVVRSIDSNATTAVPDNWRTAAPQAAAARRSRHEDSFTKLELFGSEVSAAASSISSPRPAPSPRATIGKSSPEPLRVLRGSSSAPELRFACPLQSYASASNTAEIRRTQVPRLALAVVGSPASQTKGLNAVEVAPSVVLDASVQSMPDQSAPEQNADSVISAHFRQSRSTPIFKKVKEYLSSSRAVCHKRAVPQAQTKNGAVRKTISTIEAQSPASSSAKSAKLVSPSSPASSAMSPGSPSASRHQVIVEKIQSVAAVVRARLSASLSPAKSSTVASVLEPLFEDIAHSDDSRSLAVGTRYSATPARTLARNSSAPGDISNVEEFHGAESLAMQAIGKASQASATHTMAEASPAKIPPRVPLVPKLQLSEVLKGTIESDGRRNSFPSSLAKKPTDDGASASMAQRTLLQMAQAYQQRFPMNSRPVQWTPRRSSPTRVSVTTPDPGRSATPSHVLTSRHPPLFHASTTTQTASSSQNRSFISSFSPLSPASVSPTRSRVSNAMCTYPAGTTLARIVFNSQTQSSTSSGSMAVHQPSCIVPQTFHAYPNDASGARSVGAPPPELGVAHAPGAPGSYTGGPGSYTPPVPTTQRGLVSTSTPVVQRRFRRSGHV